MRRSGSAAVPATAATGTEAGASRSLVQRVQGGEKTKSAFQSALNRLAKAQRREAFFEELVRYADQLVGKELVPAVKEFVDQLAAEGELLDCRYDELVASLPKAQRRQLREVLVAKLGDLVNSWGRHDQRDRWEKYQTPAERVELANAERMAQGMIEDMFGIKIDPADFEGEMSAEKAAEMHARYGEQLRSALGGTGAALPRNKRQQQRELERQQAQELLDRDLKRLFKDLAVKLHPDLEQDPTLKLEKEELMKSLTQARDKNDYTELLRLHAQHCDTGAAGEKLLFSDSTLKTLVQLLKEKAMGIENAIVERVQSHEVLQELRKISEDLAVDQHAVLEEVKHRVAVVRLQIQECVGKLERIQQGGSSFRQYLKAESKRLRAEMAEMEMDLDDLFP